MSNQSKEFIASTSSWARSQYVSAPITKVKRDKHKRRMNNQIDIESLPKNWEEFKNYSSDEQGKLALTFSVLVALHEDKRTDFIQGVLMEYEWELANSWYYSCDGCGFPEEFCKNL